MPWQHYFPTSSIDYENNFKLIQNNLFFVFQREKIAAADFGINESRKLQHYSILYTLD
jgi:hypothetical protein